VIAGEHAGQIWRYDPRSQKIELVVIFPAGSPFDGPDNTPPHDGAPGNAFRKAREHTLGQGSKCRAFSMRACWFGAAAVD
jgi:hypothetical protein